MTRQPFVQTFARGPRRMRSLSDDEAAITVNLILDAAPEAPS